MIEPAAARWSSDPARLRARLVRTCGPAAVAAPRRGAKPLDCWENSCQGPLLTMEVLYQLSYVGLTNAS